MISHGGASLLDRAGGGSLTAGTSVITGLTQGSVVFGGVGGILQQDNANFFWDDTNNRLGIGTSSPSTALHLSGSVGDTTDGPIFRVERIAPEGTDYFQLYISQYRDGFLNSSLGGRFQIGSTTTSMAFQTSLAGVTGLLTLGDQFASSGTSWQYRHFAYVGSASTYVQWYLNPSTTHFELSRENTTITALDIQLPTWHTLTTEQLRLRYDSSNYYTTTVNSTGGVAFDAVGSGSQFTFADNLGIGSTFTNAKFNVHLATDQNIATTYVNGFSQIVAINDAFGAYKDLYVDGSKLLLNSTSGGNVGIGVTTPACRLDVLDASANGYIINATGVSSANGGISIDSDGRAAIVATGKNTGSGGGGAYFIADGYQETWYSLATRTNTSGLQLMRFGNSLDRFKVQHLSDNGASVLTNPFSLANGAPTDSFYMTSTGYIGLHGNTSPVTWIDTPTQNVNSVAKFGALEMNSYAVNNSWIGENTYYDGANHVYRANGYASQIYFYPTGDVQIYTAPSGTAGAAATITPRMTVFNAGNIGVGTITPQAGLFNTQGIIASQSSTTLPSGRNDAFELYANGSGYNNGASHDILWAQSGLVLGRFGMQYDGGATVDFVWHDQYNSGASSVENMRLTGTGNLGLGLTIANAKFNVHLATNQNIATTYVNGVAQIACTNDAFGAYAPFYLDGSVLSLNTLSGNKVGIGTASPAAFLHTIGTTEQLRLGYDTSNYYKTTVGSTGGVIFDAVGSGAGFTFSDTVGITGATASTITSFDASKNLVSLALATYPSLTELSYVKGVTSAIQTQLNTLASYWTLSSTNLYSPAGDTVTIGYKNSTTYDTLTIEADSNSSGGVALNYTASGLGGNDANTMLLIHADSNFNDTCAGTTAHTPTLTNTPTIDTGTYKFAAGSGKFVSASSQYVTYSANSTEWNFGTGAFTIDYWVYFTTIGNMEPFQLYTDGNNYINIEVQSSSRIDFNMYVSGSYNAAYSKNDLSLSTATWYHIQMVRSTTNVYFFLNGNSQSWTSTAVPVSTNAAPNCNRARIGANVSPAIYLNGYVDEVRVSNVARNTSNFTPFTGAYDALSTVATPAYRLLSSGTQTGKMWTDGNNSNYLNFDVATTTRMTIDTSGNVGIATTAPSALLHLIKTTEQLRVGYDTSNYCKTTVSSAGAVTLDAVGTNAGFTFSDSINLPYVAKTSTYTATTNDYTIDCTSGTFTVNLPAVSGLTGRLYVIKNSGTGIITADGNSSETIDGALTYTLNTQYQSITLQCTGSAWVIL